MKLLLLEDDPVLGKGLDMLFKLEKYDVDWSKSIQEAKEYLEQSTYDIAIFDVNLPDGSGIDFCKRLRKNNILVPIIILTARTDEQSVVSGLLSGANDYMKKPFSNYELLARVIVHTRSHSVDEDDKLLEICEKKRVVIYKGKEIKLNRREFEILNLFWDRKEQIISRELIIERALDNIEVSDRTVDSHISHIRKKLRDEKIVEVSIKSEYGIGYRLVIEK